MALPLNETKIRVIVDYETGTLMNVDKLVSEVEAMKREIAELRAMVMKEGLLDA